MSSFLAIFTRLAVFVSRSIIFFCVVRIKIVPVGMCTLITYWPHPIFCYERHIFIDSIYGKLNLMADICLTCGNETNWMCVWCVYIEMTIEENWKQPLKLAIHWISEMDVRNIAYGTFAFDVFDVIVRVLFHLTANGIQYIIHIRECPWWFANAIVNSFELHWMTSNTDLYDDMAFPCKQIIQVHFFFNRFNGFLYYLFLAFYFTWIRETFIKAQVWFWFL